MALAELVERGCIEVIVTTFSPRRCDRIARAGIERRSRGGVALLAGNHRNPGACFPRDFNPHVSEDQALPIGHDSEIALTSTFAVGGAR